MDSPSDDEDDDYQFYDPRDDDELYVFHDAQQPRQQERERNAEVKAAVERIVRAEPLLPPLSFVERRLPLEMRARLMTRVSTALEPRSGASLFAFEGAMFARDHISRHRRHSWSGDYVPAGEHRQRIKMARLYARFGDGAFLAAMHQGARVPRETEDGREQYNDYYLAGSLAQWRAERARK